MAEETDPFSDQIIDIAAGLKPMPAVMSDRRSRRRVPYTAHVALLLIAPTGERSRPMVVRARDISLDGISVAGRQMIYPGSQGAMQLVRSDGRMALVGVAVRNSRYVGEMRHHTGMSFVPLPPGISAREFVGRDGRMVLLDSRLQENIEG